MFKPHLTIYISSCLVYFPSHAGREKVPSGVGLMTIPETTGILK